MPKASHRAQRQARARKKRLTNNLIKGMILFLAASAVIYFGWLILRPQVGEAVPVLGSEHVDEGQSLEPYNSNPPTSGDHYASPLSAGFYDEADLAGLPPNPDGYLVHNLEHGYIIFWYDCAQVNDCGTLKSQIQTAMAELPAGKLIAFPRDGLEAPVVMTSWGRKQAMETFENDLARVFVQRNLNRAPEGTAP